MSGGQPPGHVEGTPWSPDGLERRPGRTRLFRRQWTPEQCAVVEGLRTMILRSTMAVGVPGGHRRLVLGVSADADVWVEGEFTVLNRCLVPLAQTGLPGFTRLAQLLLHELTRELGNAGDVPGLDRANLDAGQAEVSGSAPLVALDAYVTWHLKLRQPVSRAALLTSSLRACLWSLPDLLSRCGPCMVRHHAWAEGVLLVDAIEHVEAGVWGAVARGALYRRDGECLGAVTMTDQVDDAVWVVEPPVFTPWRMVPDVMPRTLSRAAQTRLLVFLEVMAGPVRVRVAFTVDGPRPHFRVMLEGSVRDGREGAAYLTRAATREAAEHWASLARAWLRDLGRGEHEPGSGGVVSVAG